MMKVDSFNELEDRLRNFMSWGDPDVFDFGGAVALFADHRGLRARRLAPQSAARPAFCGEIARCQQGWREVLVTATTRGVPAPTFSSALAYYDSYRAERLPANLIQAHRDYFGAHTYERVDAPRGQFFHLDWPAAGRPQHKA